MNKIEYPFEYLSDMYSDSYYPIFLVDKVREEIFKLVRYLEEFNKNKKEIQNKLDIMTIAINDLNREFFEYDSEIETIARDSIAETIICILDYFNIDIDIETALYQRDW